MADIDALSIRISADAANATRNINKLANALDRLSKALNSIDPSKLNSAAQAAGMMSTAVESLKSSGRTVSSVATAMTKIGERAGSIAQAGNAVQNVGNAASGAAKSTKEVGKAAEKAAEGTKNLATSSYSAGETIRGLGSWFKNVASTAFRAANRIRLFGRTAKSSSKSASSLVKEITRIGKMLKLMLTRMVLRQIISGIGDGFKNLAQYSATFDSTLSLLWNDFRQLGNAIAAAASPLLNAFAPALHYIIQLAIQAANAINQLLSALTGLGKWTKAKTLTDSYAKSLNKAGSAAKELKKTVLGFDELNQLQDNKNSGGGGTSPADMFEEADIDKKWQDWAKKIKDMWKNADFYDLGKAIGEWLLNALNSIPWSKIYTTAAKVGKSLATLINGFVEVPTLGYTIGKSLAKAINTAFYFLDDFVRNLHWKSIGQFIGETLNGFFENIKWNKIYDTVYYGMRGLAQAFQSAIDTFHWDNISKTLINALDVISMGIKEFFEGIDWSDLGEKVGTQLTKTLRGTDWRQVGEAIGDIIKAAISFAAGLIRTFSWQDLFSAVWDAIKGVFSSLDYNDLATVIGEVLRLALIASIAKAGWITLTSKVASWFETLFGGKAVKDAVTKGAEKAVTDGTKKAVTEGAAGKAVGEAATTAGVSVGAIWAAGFVGEAIRNLDNLDMAKNLLATYGEDLGLNKEAVDLLNDSYSGLGGTIDMLTDSIKLGWYGITGQTDKLKEMMGVVDKVSEKSEKASNSVSKIYDSKAAESLANMKRDTEDASKSIGIFDTNAERAFKNMQSSCDSLKTTTGNLAVSVQKDTGSISSSVGIADTKAAQSLRDMQKNANAVTFTPLSNNIKTNTTASTSAIHIFDTKAEQSFKNLGKSAGDLEITIETESHSMDVALADAQGAMSGTIQTLSQDFGTNMSDIQKSTTDSMSEVTKAMDTVRDGMSEDNWTFSGVIDGLKNTFKSAVDGVKRIWNNFVNDADKEGDVGGSKVRINLPRFANGGFPEDGLFMANHGEMVGRFSNGKTAVANNEQITEGIARAVFNAMTTAQSSSGGQYINNTIMVDGDVIARVVTKGQERLNRRYSPTMA